MNVFILFYTVLDLEHNFKLKINPKTHIFENLEEITKTWRIFAKKNLQLFTYYLLKNRKLTTDKVSKQNF